MKKKKKPRVSRGWGCFEPDEAPSGKGFGSSFGVCCVSGSGPCAAGSASRGYSSSLLASFNSYARTKFTCVLCTHKNAKATQPRAAGVLPGKRRIPVKKLYKRTSTGAIQVWWQEVDNGQYRTHCGQEGGAIVTSSWTQAVPKNVGQANSTSPQEQALSEVESHYTRKQKDGYKTTQEAALACERFTPMLAKEYTKYADKLDLKEGVWAQPKLDGIRCIANSEGLWSRKGDKISSMEHIEEALADVFATNPDLVLDGELYNHDLRDNFNEIVSMIKKKREKSSQVQFYIYDAPSEQDFGDRITKVNLVVDRVGLPLVAVETAFVRTREELDKYYAKWLDAGYEGQMVRLSGPYQMKRSGLLLKRKEFVDSEFTVVDILEGVGNAAGGAKIAVLQHDTDSERTFKADILGTIAERKAFLKIKDTFIGKLATVKYFAQRTPAGIPRFGKVKAFWPEGKL